MLEQYKKKKQYLKQCMSPKSNKQQFYNKINEKMPLREFLLGFG